MSDLLNDCSEVRTSLHLFLGGDLDESVLATVTEHLATCSGCCREVDRARRVRGVLLAQRDSARFGSPGSLDLWTGVRGRLAAEGLLPSGTSGESGSMAPIHVMPFWRRASGLAAAGVAAALLGLGVWLADPSGSGGPGDLDGDLDGDLAGGTGSGAPVLVGHGPAAVAAPLVEPAGNGTDPVAERTAEPGATGGLRLLRAGEQPLHRGAEVLGWGREEEGVVVPVLHARPDPNRAASVRTIR